MKKQNIFTRVLVFLGILVVLNLISGQIFFRLDFTEDKRYTLSEATKNTLKNLDEVITVKAYFSEDLPPQLLSTRNDFREQLIEYENRANGYLVYEFVNPNEDEAAETKAQQEGINPLIINVTERDQVQQLRAYMGAVISMQDRKEIIPVIQPGASMEFDLTSAIKKIAITEKPRIGLLQGNGEVSLGAIPQLTEQLNILYDVEPFTLNDTTEIPLSFKSLLFINPTDTLSFMELQKLDNYLNSGGGIFLSYGNYRGAVNNGFVSNANDIGLINWLSKKNVAISNELVTDVKCASVGVPQQLGPFSVTSQVQFPYFPIINTFSDHPAMVGLEAVVLPLANAVIPTQTDSTIETISLAFTSEQSGNAPLPLMVDINKEWSESEFPQSNQSVAVAVSNLPGKMVVIGCGNFSVNGEPGQQQQLNPDNLNFVANAIDWMSDDTGLNDLRTKGVTSRPLAVVEDSTKNILKYGNVLMPILLVLGYGFYRKQKSLRKRQQWLEGKYL